MDFEWDLDKARINLEKHGIAFRDAVTALEDESAITVEDEGPDEERFATIGLDAAGRLLVVIYTYREDNIRIISARMATNRELKVYESRNI